MGVDTSTSLDALYMLVLGMGIGGVMQVLVIIVQNGVPHSELGVATSGATFFRSIGGSFGTAIFGAIFANVLVGNLARHLHGVTLPHGFSSADATPALLGHLPAAVHAGFVAGYAESIQTVFLVAVPIAALAFLATWLIPQVELKQWSGAGAEAPDVDVSVPAATAAPSTETEAPPWCSRSPWTRRTPAASIPEQDHPRDLAKARSRGLTHLHPPPHRLPGRGNPRWPSLVRDELGGGERRRC